MFFRSSHFGRTWARRIERICETFLDFKETGQSRIFSNEEFGYWKVTVERSLRLAVDLSEDKLRQFRADCGDVGEESLARMIDRVTAPIGPDLILTSMALGGDQERCATAQGQAGREM